MIIDLLTYHHIFDPKFFAPVQFLIVICATCKYTQPLVSFYILFINHADFFFNTYLRLKGFYFTGLSKHLGSGLPSQQYVAAPPIVFFLKNISYFFTRIKKERFFSYFPRKNKTILQFLKNQLTCI